MNYVALSMNSETFMASQFTLSVAIAALSIIVLWGALGTRFMFRALLLTFGCLLMLMTVSGCSNVASELETLQDEGSITPLYTLICDISLIRDLPIGCHINE
jgi:Na+/melibiose symporter-like transporter